VRFLVDTHVLLWLVGRPGKVPPDVRDRLADPANELYVSAISALEVATKTRLGRLDPVGLVEGWTGRLSDIGAIELSVTGDQAVHAGSMPWKHRDPFDRVLVSQAMIEGLSLVTVDRALTDLPAPRIVTW
jgi:PIN domain nuclease of toxin-antitoxin system